MRYTLAFLSFGLTDIREAFALQSWPIRAKSANLLVLSGLRSVIIGRLDPGSKWS